MPLTFTYKGQVSATPGVIPGMAMGEIGPLISVILMPGTEHAERVWLMVDTGAQKTVVEKRFPERYGLTPIRFDEILGVSGEPVPAPVYRMKLRLTVARGDNGAGHGLDFDADIIGTDSSATVQHDGLLGRDFLSMVKLVYDGPDDTFKIVLIEGKSPLVKMGGDVSRPLLRSRARKSRKRDR